MKPSRSFRPSALVPLEGRVVPSAIGATGVPPSVVTSAILEVIAGARKQGESVQRVSLSSAQIAQSNASDTAFGLSPGDTLRAGQPVAEQVTTTYSVGSQQTETLLKVPDASNNSVTTYKTIDLRNSGGTETVVSTETYSGGAVLFTGTHNTFAITTTLPNGSVQTTTESQVITGRKTVTTATVHEANGGVETWTSASIKHGPTTAANKTITEPNGETEHQTIVTTRYGDLDSTTRTTTMSPGEILMSRSATNVIRVQPPSS